MAGFEEGVAISASSESPQLRKIDRYCQPSCCCCICGGKRWTMALLMMFGFIVTFGMRCNMGVALVKIMSSTTNEYGEVMEREEFHWTPETIGYVDVSFFWGFVLTQLPGGILTTYFPAHYVFGAGILLSSCLNLLIPAATFDPKAVSAVRFIQGLADGITIPASYGIWRWWAPALERTCLATLAFSGSYLGSVIGMPLAGLLSEQGWKIPFYFYGCAGIVWFFFWLWLAFEKPSKHPASSVYEKQFIEESIGGSQSVGPTIKTTPWLKMLISLPVWAIILASFSNHMTNYLILVASQQYFRSAFGDFERVSFLVSLLPNLITALNMPITGFLADFLRKKKIMRYTNIRKIFNTAGMGGQVLFLLVIGFGTDKMVALFALYGIATANGVAQSGFHFNHLDIAPRYASILVGITNTVGVFGGLLSPVLTAYLLRTFTSWQYVFIAASVINSLGGIFYTIFASGEVQQWAVTLGTNNVEMKGETSDVNN